MRLGLILYGNLDQVSGGYLYDRMVVNYLRNQGDQVELISLPWRNYLLHLGDNFSPVLMERMRNLKVDVLLQDELNHPSLFLINDHVRDQVSYPFVSIVHHMRGSEQHSRWLIWFNRWVERRYLKSLDGIIFNSITTKNTVEAVMELQYPTVVALPAADHLNPRISSDEIAKRAQRDGPLQLVFLGNVIQRKGLHTLIDAMKGAEENIFRLSVVGSLDADERYTRSMHARIARSDLAQIVTFLGNVMQAELKKILLESHLLVVPSSYEGFGIVYLEGMGYGLPAIASTAGGAVEIITNGVDGFLIEPGDADELQKHLIALHYDRELLCDMSLAALKRYREHPGWDQTGETIRQYLLSVRRGWYASSR